MQVKVEKMGQAGNSSLPMQDNSRFVRVGEGQLKQSGDMIFLFFNVLDPNVCSDYGNKKFFKGCT